MVVGAQGGRAGGSSSQRLRYNSLGARRVLPRRWLVLKEGLWGAVALNSLLGGTGSPPQVVVGAQQGPAGVSGYQWPGNTSLGGRGVVPRRWSMLKEGLPEVAVFSGPGTLASGDGEPSLGGGRCSRRACGG